MYLLTFSLETETIYKWAPQKGELGDERQGQKGLYYNSSRKEHFH